ncbi:MAG TPA: superoxide dismutase [Micromonosporaceae bacterium]|nr:superoxide dismutase [Micromonosporaceae bacterium]
MRRRTLLAGALAIPASAATLGVASPASAGEAATGGHRLPATIALPAGWRPEGITAGRGTTFYVGSLANGAIYRGDLRTGRGSTFVAGREGGQAVGLEFDRWGRLWVCGGGTGGAVVYDGATGARLAEYSFGGTFVNDAVVTSTTAYFTDSYRPVLYAVPLGAAGRLPDQSAVRTIQLTGGLAEAGAFNNGIEATGDGRLLIVQMLAGRLYAFDPGTGAATQVDLGGASVLQGDGLLRRGRILYVVRNFANVIAKFRLDDGLTSATLLEEITSPAFDVPATVAALGPWLYAVNARFNLAEPTPETSYNVVRVRG